VSSALRLFEIHEQPWFPQSLRDQFVDGLQMILEVTNTYQPIAHLLRKRLEECGSQRVTANRIHFIPNSIDATQIPRQLQGFRTLFSSFHHLKPDEARSLLQNSVDRREGIGIFEATAFHLLTFVTVLFVPIGAWLFLPFRRPFRWSRVLWTYFIPVIPFVLFFDGLVSCLRSYSLGELREMTSGLECSGYRWEVGEQFGGLLPVRITYVVGCPQNVSAESAD
jgi:hypothetical protein